jgi:H+/Cl- antiporter ClcA
MWALIAAAVMAAILGGVVGVIFVPMFLIGGLVFYAFARAWMRDVLEVGNRTKPGIHS